MSATTEQIQALYDFESIFPTACKQVFVDAGMNALTISDPPELQKVRPRVEITYRHAGNHSGPVLKIIGDGTTRVVAFDGELFIHAISDCDIPGKAVHSQYRALVRNIYAMLPWLMNGGPLALHSMHFPPISESENHGINSREGFEISTFTMRFTFSMQAQAWAVFN
jgi:hypothetical protein